MRNNKKSKKGRQQKTENFPLFQVDNKGQTTTPLTQKANNSPHNVICFSTAIESKKKRAQSSLEQSALEAILVRARKLDW